MLSIKLFRLVLCLFRFTRNIKTLCFGIEAKQPKQTILKQTKPNRKKRKTLNFPEKNQNTLHIKLFRLVFCLFWFNRNIENQNKTSFEGHPNSGVRYYTRKKRCQYLRYRPTPKKSLATFPSAARMSLTKLSLGGNN
jgi:hypothetical protein